jgi:hypothetical protein
MPVARLVRRGFGDGVLGFRPGRAFLGVTPTPTEPFKSGGDGFLPPRTLAASPRVGKGRAGPPPSATAGDANADSPFEEPAVPTTRPVMPLAGSPRRPVDHGDAVAVAAPSRTFDAVWTVGPGRSVLATLPPRLLACPRGQPVRTCAPKRRLGDQRTPGGSSAGCGQPTPGPPSHGSRTRGPGVRGGCNDQVLDTPSTLDARASLPASPSISGGRSRSMAPNSGKLIAWRTTTLRCP